MCSPLATGSRQASWTIWARCRGGNLLGTAHAGSLQQEFLQAALLVTAAGTPDGGPTTLQTGSNRLAGFPRGDSQHDTGTLDLEEGQVAAVCHGLQNGSIRSSDSQGMGLSATHGETSDA